MVIPSENENVTLVGHVDAYDPDQGWMIEFKSTRFVNWQKEKGLLPHEHHVQQIRSYFTMWTKCYNFPVDKLFVAYVDDQTPPMCFEIAPYDLTQWLRERTSTLHKALLEKITPVDEPTSLCNYCAFKDYCRVLK